MSRIKLAFPKALRLDEMTLPNFWQILVTLFTAAFLGRAFRTQRHAGGRAWGSNHAGKLAALRARKKPKATAVSQRQPPGIWNARKILSVCGCL
jgi:hypothetical protein